jgi:hypothetical protein
MGAGFAGGSDEEDKSKKGKVKREKRGQASTRSMAGTTFKKDLIVVWLMI